ncbi:MAG: hypothetical protein JWO88_2004 [Frankiales bacterium]|nr:hypothetical protein [Frankiales bacterium]
MTPATRRFTRLLTATLVSGSVAFAFMPVAHAGDSRLSPSKEGWYTPNPTCAQASGCLPGTLPVTPPVPITTSPYPARTMHVGWDSSAETARAYLSFPLDSLSGTLTAAQLDVPLDVAPADGDQQSATAKIQVCLATADFAAVDGSIDQPPGIACQAHAAVSYVATPAPHLHADLAPLLIGLATSPGIVLLPDAQKNAASDAWRVVFSAHDRTDSAKTAPALLTVQVSEEPVISTPEAPTVELPGVPASSGFAPAPATGFVPAPALPAVVAPVAPLVPAPDAPQPANTAQTVTYGYVYPAVWLLPLAFLVLVPLATNALTKDLAPV